MPSLNICQISADKLKIMCDTYCMTFTFVALEFALVAINEHTPRFARFCTHWVALHLHMMMCLNMLIAFLILGLRVLALCPRRYIWECVGGFPHQSRSIRSIVCLRAHILAQPGLSRHLACIGGTQMRALCRTTHLLTLTLYCAAH